MNERPIGWGDISREDLCCNEFLEAIRNMDPKQPGISPYWMLSRIIELNDQGKVTDEELKTHLPFIQASIIHELGSQTGEYPNWLLDPED